MEFGAMKFARGVDRLSGDGTQRGYDITHDR